MSASASQRKTLSISEQLELIDDVKVKKLKLAAAAKKYGIGYSTAAKILKKEDNLRSCMQMNGSTNCKRKRQSVHKDVNEVLTQWFTQACAHGATVTDRVIRQKASQLAVNLEVDFEPSNGWLMRWKQANNVSFKKFHGESMSADHSSANEWVTNVLPQLFRLDMIQKMFGTVMKREFSTKPCRLDLCDLPATNSQMGQKFPKTDSRCFSSQT
ncbi:unnamed protein product [Acanthosepion pharaonis]|uniref:HTH CENPB-type domain-containing protein n=1 Tax=Acanthosepion pharaonis TaxID=158019 RepID=A0A812AUD7_ACAPH|nr:unnamed protein product [Sepia pharaonis]